MTLERKNPRKKIVRMSIFIKLLLASIVSTIIPLIITGLLIVSTYQGLINEFLVKREQGTIEKINQDLFLNLENIRIQTGLTLFIIIILSLFSSILMSRNLTQPLRKLVKGTEEVAKGNLDFKIELESRDELGELSIYFNKMTQQLKEITVALREAKSTLEVRVKARTKELEELAQSLDEKVKERTKELQKRIGDLERFHRLTVGRELKMIELKKEIKKIQKELKETEIKKKR